MHDHGAVKGTGLFRLDGRTALVTGSTRGIGLAFAHALAEAGARVVVHGRDLAAVEAARGQVAAAATAAGSPDPAAVRFDVTDPDAVAEAFAGLDAAGLQVDVLICNAAVQHRESLLEIAAADFDRVLRTNITGVFLPARAAAHRMVVRGHGKIVAVGSVQSELARPSIAPYAASKGALRMLIRGMCAEWAGRGITVNALAPGYIHTQMTQALVADDAFSAWVQGRTPAGRWGRVEDLTGTLLWLASPASDFVNGQTVFVDGGMTAVV